jgi:predicted ATPase
MVPHSIAAELGLRDLPQEPMDQVIGFLRDKSTLLVVDNCEHLADSCGTLIGKIRTTASHVRVVATSRHLLGIEGEQLMVVPPLPVPPAGPDETIVATDAVPLLVHRVNAVDPNFALGSDNTDVIATIRRRLDGIPLALEAARLLAHYDGDLPFGFRYSDGRHLPGMLAGAAGAALALSWFAGHRPAVNRVVWDAALVIS